MSPRRVPHGARGRPVVPLCVMRHGRPRPRALAPGPALHGAGLCGKRIVASTRQRIVATAWQRIVANTNMPRTAGPRWCGPPSRRPPANRDKDGASIPLALALEGRTSTNDGTSIPPALADKRSDAVYSRLVSRLVPRRAASVASHATSPPKRRPSASSQDAAPETPCSDIRCPTPRISGSRKLARQASICKPADPQLIPTKSHTLSAAPPRRHPHAGGTRLRHVGPGAAGAGVDAGPMRPGRCSRHAIGAAMATIISHVDTLSEPAGTTHSIISSSPCHTPLATHRPQLTISA